MNTCRRIANLFLLSCAVLCAARAQSPSAPRHPRWNATPNDVNNMLKQLRERVDAHYSMEIKAVDELDTDPARNPIVYYSGHYNYTFTEAQRQRLRDYLLNGGFMIFNTGLGSAPFYRSTLRELEAILPEQPLQRLSPDHPLFHAYFSLNRVQYSPGVYATGFQGDEPWIEGITLNCRTVAIVSRFCLAVGWDGGEIQPEFAAYMPDSAQQLGVNMISYATAMRAWAQNAAQAMRFTDADDHAADRLSIAQVIYDGEWKTRHVGLSVLLQSFNYRTEIPVRFNLREMRLTDPDLSTAPLLYLTGHEYFEMSAEEVRHLRDYLHNGGFLLAEACCGRTGFDLALRRLIRQVLPEHPLNRIRDDSPLLQTPNLIQTVGVTPLLAADLGRATIAPQLEGVTIDGWLRLVYSPYGLAGGWEMSQSPYARGYHADAAIKIGQNILLHAVTH